MNSGNGSRTIEQSVSLDNIKDQIAALLYATGVVHDNEDIEELVIPGVNTPIVNIKIKIRGEVEQIKH